MTVQQLVASYESGVIIAHELVVDCLSLVDPGDPSVILGQLPSRALPWLREFLDAYKPGEVLSLHGGIVPSQSQVLAAKKWLDQPVRNDSIRS